MWRRKKTKYSHVIFTNVENITILISMGRQKYGKFTLPLNLIKREMSITINVELYENNISPRQCQLCETKPLEVNDSQNLSV